MRVRIKTARQIVIGAVMAFVWLDGMRATMAEDVRVFILAGQSNAVGFRADADELPKSLQQPREDIWFFYEEGMLHAGGRVSSEGAFVALGPQDNAGTGALGGVTRGCGPELTLGRTLATHLPGRVAIVKFAINGTSLAVDWDPRKPGTLYEQMMATVDAAVTQLKVKGDRVTVACVFWMQGESDSIVESHATAYERNLIGLIEKLRSRLGDERLPWVVGRINANLAGEEFPHVQTVREAQENVAHRLPEVTYIDTDDVELLPDKHVAPSGHMVMGQRFAEAYLKLSR